MSRSWNGKSLVDELSAQLGDTSSAFKTRVLGWLNDVIFDISSRHDWGFHLTSGKKFLEQDAEIQSLEIAPPDAPLCELVSGGELTANVPYKFLLTYVQSNGIESKMGTESAAITPTDTDKKIKLSNLSTSDETLVSGRNLYVSVNGGAYYFHSLIDSYSSSVAIESGTSSTQEPPDFETIRRLYSDPYFEEGPSRKLIYKDAAELRSMIEGKWEIGDPIYFSPIETNSITTYPISSSGYELSFYFYRYPKRLYNLASSQPDLPIHLKPALKAGVIALGYEYRDRAGQEIKRANYENEIVTAINRGGRIADVEYVVKDVYGTPFNTGGF